MTPAARALIAAALALAAFDAGALVLGEPQVRSTLGEPLDVRIPVTLGPGESIEPSCFKLAAGSGDGPRVTSASVSLERSASGTWLRLRGVGGVSDPALALSLVASCTGQAEEYRRDYALALGASGATRSTAAQTAAASIPASPAPASEPMLPSIATLIARIGDTLASIAEAIFPSNHGAQRTYIAALRESNPPLARLADDEPIPVDTPVALPDLRTFARGRHVEPDTQVASATPAPKRAAPPMAAPSLDEAPARKAPAPATAPRTSLTRPSVAQKAPPPPREAASRAAPAGEAAPRPAKPAAASPRTRANDGFMLRLSAPEVDLARSRGIDDRSRQELRERLLILDADDQVAALLSLRHSVKQLESQVAALQLKLSGMPSSFPAPQPPKSEPAPAPAPAPAPVAKSEPAPAPPPAKPEPPPAPKVEAPAPKAEAPAKIEAPAPKVEEPAAKAEPAKPEPPAVAPPPTPAKPVIPVAPQSNEWLDYALWAIAVLLAVVAIVFAVRLARRKRDEAGFADEEVVAPQPAAPLHEHAADDQIIVADEVVSEPEIAAEAPSMAIPARRELDSDVELATRLPSNTDDLRRRYIEERFPEIGKGAISIDDPDSVVKGARLFYEDGELTRAVELLQYAIERNPAQVKSWLALFEIFRLERLTGEFSELITRFREHHGKSDYWRKVQYFGREIDPGNPLYQEAPIDHFETISPTRAARMAQDFDPIAENWLGAPMDFENEVLANELRMRLMADAGINEPDLVPNPMPALRSIEMFTVA